MSLHPSAFEYCELPEDQIAKVEVMYKAAAVFAGVLDAVVPSGPDKTFVLRNLRTTAMWAMVAITRKPDGELRD